MYEVITTGWDNTGNSILFGNNLDQYETGERNRYGDCSKRYGFR